MYYAYLLLALLAAFAVGLITGTARHHGAKWTAAESLASGFAGIASLIVAIGLVLLFPNLGRAVWRIADDRLGEDATIAFLLAITILGAVVGLLPVLRLRRRRMVRSSA
jgi:hypothetical protein